jgi:uncharacterized protein YbjT (DUF2867 family)
MNSKTAIVVGASGLVGNQLIQLLLDDNSFEKIKIMVRKKMAYQHSKLEQIIVDFDNLQKSAAQISGDVLFCALGTTIKAAGSQAAFSKVDYSYVLEIATIAKQNNVQRFVLVSSLGVTEGASNFYLTVKRDIENALKKLNFNALIIVRPSMLLGTRTESRMGESIGKFFMQLLRFMFIGKLKKYKAIQAVTVAKAMITLSKNELHETCIFESDRLQELGK